MPSVSQRQQAFMGASYGRAKAGKRRKSDPNMSMADLRDFAATPRKGLPKRARKRRRK